MRADLTDQSIQAQGQLRRLAQSVADALAANDCLVCFAESCTAGLVSATLAATPGISRFLCGSAVTYREQTKQVWLGVTEGDMCQYSAVSEVVTIAMARGVLARTPEAHLAVAVTGHLGPDAPPKLDGTIYVAWLTRAGGRGGNVFGPNQGCAQVRLASAARSDRQREATAKVLEATLRLFRQ